MITTGYTEKRNIGEYVYQTIRQRIIDWTLKPGQQLSEKLVSEELQVSRTPVREAFIKLTGEQLIEARPYVGTFVTRIDVGQVEEARFIRESLERSVAVLACGLDMAHYAREARVNIAQQAQRMEAGDIISFIELDDAFHRLLFTVCEKEMTWNVVSTVNSQYNRLRILCLRADVSGGRLTGEHEQIVSAVERGECEPAAQAVTNHLRKILREMDIVKAKYPDYFLSRP